MNLTARELSRLANALNRMVYSIDTEGVTKTADRCDQIIALIDSLQWKHANCSLLYTAREAVANLSTDTRSFYIVARDIIRMANRQMEAEGGFWEKYSWKPLSTTLLTPGALVVN